MVIEDLEEPEVKLDYFGGTSGNYAGFDRFDRIIDQRWYDYGASEDRDRFKYGYDRASNRTWKENVVSKNLGTPIYLDEFYTYDGIHRLRNFDRGELNNPHSAIPNPQFSEGWTLDPLGNWSNYIQKTNGTTDLDQERAVNRANEITDITEATGTSWSTPIHDRAGNMTSIPQPADLPSSYDLTWDAWNRLVKVEDDANTVAVFHYDGQNRQATSTKDSTLRHFLHSDKWQIIEERIDDSPHAEQEFVWSPRHRDHLLLRDRDSSEPRDGVLDERLYALRDANTNVTNLVQTDGQSVECYAYNAYGSESILTSTYGNRNDSLFDWQLLFSSRPRERETGLLNVRSRRTHVKLGSLVSRDWIEADHNRYLYAGGNPINFVDPSGFQKETPQPPEAPPKPPPPFEGPKPAPVPGPLPGGLCVVKEGGKFDFDFTLPLLECYYAQITVGDCKAGPVILKRPVTPGGCAGVTNAHIEGNARTILERGGFSMSCSAWKHCGGVEECCNLLNIHETSKIVMPFPVPVPLLDRPRCVGIVLAMCSVARRLSAGYCCKKKAAPAPPRIPAFPELPELPKLPDSDASPPK